VELTPLLIQAKDRAMSMNVVINAIAQMPSPASGGTLSLAIGLPNSSGIKTGKTTKIVR
jgi:hypothetical protein